MVLYLRLCLHNRWRSGRARAGYLEGSSGPTRRFGVTVHTPPAGALWRLLLPFPTSSRVSPLSTHLRPPIWSLCAMSGIARCGSLDRATFHNTMMKAGSSMHSVKLVPATRDTGNMNRSNGPLAFLLLLLLAIPRPSDAASLVECLQCAWPYSSGVNSSGKCYPTYSGFQANLAAGCAAYCNSWQASADTLQTVYSVRSYSEPIGGSAPLCECVRLNKGGFVSYKTRPQGVCDWGYSDDLQNYYDSLAVNYRSSESQAALAAAPQPSPSMTAFRQALAAAVAAGKSYMTCGSTQPEYQGPYVSYIQFMNTDNMGATLIDLPEGTSCADWESGALSGNAAIPAQILKNQMSNDTAMRRLNSGIEAINQSVNASQNSILSAIANSDSVLMDRMNRIGGGGGDPVDLSPVITAVESSRDTVLASIDHQSDTLLSAIAGSRDSVVSLLAARSLQIIGNVESGRDSVVKVLEQMSYTSTARHSEVIDSLTSLSYGISGISSALTGLGDSISSGASRTVRQLEYLSDTLKSGFARNGATIDSFAARVNRLLDRGYDLDQATNVIMDSLYKSSLRSEGSSRSLLDSSVSGFNRLHSDLRAIKDSMKITVVDSSTQDSISLDIKPLLDTIHNFHSDFRNLSDSIVKWQNNRERLGDSLYSAWGIDSLKTEDPYYGIDTNAIKEQAASYFTGLREQASAESTFISGMIPDGTCEVFPADPKVTLTGFNNYVLTIPLAQKFPFIFNFLKSIIIFTAYVIDFFMWYQFIKIALAMNRHITATGEGNVL